MPNPQSIFHQISKLTEDLIRSGLCIMQNFPSKTHGSRNITEIGITGSHNSICLKNIPYDVMYQELLKSKSYNIKMDRWGTVDIAIQVQR